MKAANVCIDDGMARKDIGADAEQRAAGADRWRPRHIILGVRPERTSRETAEMESAEWVAKQSAPRCDGQIAKVRIADNMPLALGHEQGCGEEGQERRRRRQARETANDEYQCPINGPSLSEVEIRRAIKDIAARGHGAED